MPSSIDRHEYLSVELERLDVLLHREILRLRATYELSLDEFRGLYISDEQVNQLIDNSVARNGATPLTEELTQQAEALRRASEQQSRGDFAWNRLVVEFALSPTEQDILLLAAAPEINLKYETLYAYLNNDVTRKWPTCGLALRLLSASSEEQASVRRCLASNALLFNSGLLQWNPITSERSSWLASGFSISPAVLPYLAEISSLDPRLVSFAEYRMPVAGWEDLPISTDQRMGLRRLADRFATLSKNEPTPWIIFAGRDGSGRRAAAEAICRQLELTLLSVDLEALRASGENPGRLLPTLLMQQRLGNSVLYLERCEALFDKEGKPLPDGRRILKTLMQSKRPGFIACESNTHVKDLLLGRYVVSFHFDDPDYSTRLQLWQHALAKVNATVDTTELQALADRFALTPGQIAAAAATASGEHAVVPADAGADSVPAPQALDPATLFAAARAQSSQSLGNLAVKVRMIHSWDDLVLPAVTAQRVREVATAIKFRHVVYSDWGFAERISSGQGLKTLFAGASGTGKTMTAGVIAKELGLDLYKIDLSAIVSKYIGETEKNLDNIFRAAHSSNAILFFDEADALFGKRSEVKDAHDRYANIEVAYLLQKIEEYEGVVILASNLSKNIDEAFARRMHYVVEFPMPDETHRERLWHGMFPSRVPLGADVDFKFIARQFAISGGDIQNVALDAAFLAARDGNVVTMKQLIHALARQMTKQGRVPSPTEFKQYHELIAQQE